MNTDSQQNDLASILAQAGRGAGRKRKVLAGALAALVVGAVAAALLAGRGAPPRAWRTAEVSRGDLEVTITATGEVRGVNTVEVGAEVSGRIVELLVDHNSLVEEGQLLARIDPEKPAAAVKEAEARVAAARASLLQQQATRTEAEANLKRAEAQDREGLIARQDLDTARATAQRARAAVASARAQLQLEEANLASARTTLARTEIRSPIKGMILSRLVEHGQTVTAGFQTPVLFKVTADLRKMRVHAEVDESDVGRVRAGQKARFTVDAWPDRSFEAVVEAVRNEPIESETVVAYETLLTVDNEEGLLRPGMTATVTIVVDAREDVLLVPNAALRFQPPTASGFRGPPVPGLGGPPPGAASRPQVPQGPAVWVDGPGGPTPVPVRVRATDGRRSEIEAEGLEPGSKVIVGVAETQA